MAVKPITCRAHEVRAMLDGRQTQLRRVLKPQPFSDGYYDGKVFCDAVNDYRSDGIYFRFSATAVGGNATRTEVYEPSYDIGDLLWVRETFADHPCALKKISAPGEGHPWGSPIYTATFGALLKPVCEGFSTWRSGAAMPRWASRLTLRVTDVRVQRLREISTDDAIAEGIEANEAGLVLVDGGTPMTAKAAFRALWQSIHGPESWAANPWVAAYTFEVLPGNVAMYEKEAP